MRIFGGMEHLTPRRSGRSKNDAAAGATDRKKEGRGVEEGVRGVEQSLVFVLRRRTGIFPACETPGLYFLSFSAHRVIFTPSPALAIPSLAAPLALLDFYGNNPPTRNRANDTSFIH